MRDNYRDIAYALQRRESFVGNSAAGYITPSGRYVVTSYHTTILSVEGGRVVYFDNRFYSVTTSRLQAMIRQTFPKATGGRTDRVVYDY
jgi:hypothetical protein